MTTDVRTLIRELPLKDMDAALLTLALRAESVSLGFNVERIDKALELAALCHRTQTRANRGIMPRTHYIEHPLRNALRLIRYGVHHENTIIAAILHDVVEDGQAEILALAGNTTATTFEERRLACLEYLNHEFGTVVAYVVSQVTNQEVPAYLSKDDKRLVYIAHIKELLAGTAPAQVLAILVKASDLVDNAVGLYHNDVAGSEKMVRHLAAKYQPLMEPLMDRIQSEDVISRMSEKGHKKLIAHIEKGARELNKILAKGK